MHDSFYLESLITTVKDWPRPGVDFRDISPLLDSPKAVNMIVDSLKLRYFDADLTHIAAIDARGFLFAPILAYSLNLPFFMLRKPGKLPGAVLSESYSSEYRDNAELEIQENACGATSRVLLMDDLIATGGTLLAGISLIKRCGAQVHEVASLIDLPDLGGSARLTGMGIPVYSLCAFSNN